MVKLETIKGLAVYVNPEFVQLVWADPSGGDQCTIVLPEGQMTQVKGSAGEVALKLAAG
jgi:uncharacterized protein YlzI (FlbEa/FlbD family)